MKRNDARAKNWFCCCSVKILLKPAMNSRMFHDSLQFAITTSHSHSRQKKKLSSSSSSFLWGLFNDSKGRSPPDSGIWSTKRLRSCWPGDQKNDSDSKNEILILKGELTYYPPLGRRWNHLSSLLLWGDIYIYNILYINIFLYIYILVPWRITTLVLLVTGSHDLGQNIQSMTTLTSTTTATARRPLFPNIPDTILSGAFLRWTARRLTKYSKVNLGRSLSAHVGDVDGKLYSNIWCQLHKKKHVAKRSHRSH